MMLEIAIKKQSKGDYVMPVKKRPSIKSGKSESKTKKTPVGSAKLDTVVAEINKKYGDGAVRIGLPNKNLLRVPTGLISSDIDLGGGVPVGRAINIAGGFSVAKTTLALHILKAFQKAGYPCAFFDIEGTSGTDEYLTGIGVDINSLMYSNPSSLEEVCNMILDIQKGGVFKFALWDCLIVAKPNKIVEKNVGDSVQMGVMQVILDEFFSKFAMNNNKLEREGNTPFTLITVNQLREKPTMYGNPEYTPGGRAKDFAFSIDLRLRRAEFITEGKGNNKSVVGQVVSYKTEKNKTYKRYQEGQLDLYIEDNNLGIPKFNFDTFKSLVTEAVAFGIIEQGGAWYMLDVERGLKFQGFDKLVEYLREHPEEVESLEQKLLSLVDNG